MPAEKLIRVKKKNTTIKSNINKPSRYLIAVCACIFILSQTLYSQNNKVLSAISEQKTYKLKNGLTLIVLPNPLSKETYCKLYFDIEQSIYYYQNALNRITINSLPQPLQTLHKKELDSILAKNGIFLSSAENSLTGISNSQNPDSLFEIMNKIYSRKYFNEKEVNENIKIETEKINKISEQEKAKIKIYEKYLKKESENITYINEILRNTDSIKVFTNYSNNFLSSKKYLIVISDLPKDTIISKTEKYFSKPQTGNPVNEKNNEISDKNDITCIYTDSILNKSSAHIMFVSELNPNINSENYIHIKIIEKIFQNQKTGRFYSNTIVKNKAINAYSEFCKTNTPAHLFTYTQTQEKNISNICNIQHQTIDSFIDTLVSEGEKELAVNTEIEIFLKSLDKFEFISDLVLECVKYKLPENYFENYTGALKNTDTEDLKKTAEKYFISNNNAYLIISQQSITAQNELIKLAENKNINIYKNDTLIETLSKGFNAENISTTYLEKLNIEKKIPSHHIEIEGFYVFGEDTSIISQTINRDKNRFECITYMQISKKEKLAVEKILILGKKAYMITKDFKLEYQERDFDRISFKYDPFQELSFSKDSIEAKLVGKFNCDSVFAYKVEIITPWDISYNNYYDVNTKYKILQEDLKDAKVIRSTVISDYRQIPGSNNIIFPFKKEIKEKNYYGCFEIKKFQIDYKPKPKDFLEKL